MGYQEEKQRQLDLRYLRMAAIWAENSYCVRRKVGALIVKDRMIISDGYNGTPAGFENVCEDEQGLTKSYVLHAEANAITKVAKSANNCDGSTLYIQPPRASNARNSLSRRASNEWFTRTTTVRRRGWTCCAASASSAYSTGSTGRDPERQTKNRERETLRSPFFIPNLHPARKRPGSERQRTTGNRKKHRPRGEGENAYKAKVMRNAGPGRHIP